jgi:hypothetical protein
MINLFWSQMQREDFDGLFINLALLCTCYSFEVPVC